MTCTTRPSNSVSKWKGTVSSDIHSYLMTRPMLSSYTRYGDWTWCLRVRSGLYRLFTDGG
jgi:hypothetical protein